MKGVTIMACETMRKPNQTKEQRAAAVRAALSKLEQRLQGGQVTVSIGPQGAVAFVGWSPVERDDVTDACAYRTLQARHSWALQQAVMKAEALSGRRVSQSAVAGGVHSHDGGKTWHPGH